MLDERVSGLELSESTIKVNLGGRICLTRFQVFVNFFFSEELVRLS